MRLGHFAGIFNAATNQLHSLAKLNTIRSRVCAASPTENMASAQT